MPLTLMPTVYTNMAIISMDTKKVNLGFSHSY